MERLTESYIKKGTQCTRLKVVDEDGHRVDKATAVERLAMFEDFMEDFGFEDLVELEHYLGFIYWDGKKSKYAMYKNRYDLLCSQNLALKERWEELQKWILGTKSLRDKMPYTLQQTIMNKVNELEKRYE